MNFKYITLFTALIAFSTSMVYSSAAGTNPLKQELELFQRELNLTERELSFLQKDEEQKIATNLLVIRQNQLLEQQAQVIDMLNNGGGHNNNAPRIEVSRINAIINNTIK